MLLPALLEGEVPEPWGPVALILESLMTTQLEKALLSRLRKNLIKRLGIGKGQGILIALSGGPDSVFLLETLYRLKDELRLGLEVCHFDHGLRGEESRRDARFSQLMAARLGLEFHLGSGDVKAFSREKGISVQEAARALRYDFFQDTLRKRGLDFLATGHTADDQAEEVMIRLIRGSGLPGLGGIPWKRDGWIIRPILNFKRKEIASYLDQNRIEYIIDSSNLKDTYLRNRIRHRLIPLLEKEFNPAIVDTLTRTCQVIQTENAFLQQCAKEAYQLLALEMEPAQGRIVLLADKLLGFHPAILRRVIRLALEDIGIHSGILGTRHILSIEDALSDSGPHWELHMPFGVCVTKRQDRLLILSSSQKEGLTVPTDGPEKVIIQGPGTYPAPKGSGWVNIRITIPETMDEVRKPCPFPRPIYIDASKADFPLRLRTRRPGDRFWPLGAPSPLKLKDFLISRKIPRDIRDVLPILCKDDEIICIVGVEVAHPFKILKAQLPVLKITWESKFY